MHLLPKLDGRVVAKQPAQPNQRHEEQRQRHAHDRGELRGELGLRGSPVGAFARMGHATKMRTEAHSRCAGRPTLFASRLFGTNPNSVSLHPPNRVFSGRVIHHDQSQRQRTRPSPTPAFRGRKARWEFRPRGREGRRMQRVDVPARLRPRDE